VTEQVPSITVLNDLDDGIVVRCTKHLGAQSRLALEPSKNQLRDQMASLQRPKAAAKPAGSKDTFL